MSDKHWSEVAAEAAEKAYWNDPLRVADAIRTALAGYVVVERCELRVVLVKLAPQKLTPTLRCDWCNKETSVSGAFIMEDAEHAEDCPLAAPSPRGEQATHGGGK